eukprot:8610966-Pyramimonas_sp.AAC.1
MPPTRFAAAYKELHRRPQRQGPRARFPAHFGTPLARFFVAPSGSPKAAVAKAAMAGSACARFPAQEGFLLYGLKRGRAVDLALGGPPRIRPA